MKFIHTLRKKLTENSLKYQYLSFNVCFNGTFSVATPFHWTMFNVLWWFQSGRAVSVPECSGVQA